MCFFQGSNINWIKILAIIQFLCRLSTMQFFVVTQAELFGMPSMPLAEPYMNLLMTQ